MLGIRRACGAPPGLLGKLDASGEKAAAGKCSRSPLSPTSPLQAVLLLSWGCAGWESPWGLVQTWGLREVGGAGSAQLALVGTLVSLGSGLIEHLSATS